VLQLKKYSYGKHILAHLEKTMPDSSRVRLKFPNFCLIQCSTHLQPRVGSKAKAKGGSSKGGGVGR